MKKSILLLFISITISLTFTGCKKQNSAPANNATQGANEVWIQNNMFGPSTITVAVNTTIKWTNKDAIAHTVTSNSGLFDSGTINSGGTYSHQFTTTGTFPYHCTIHPFMTATVIVQ